MLLGTPQDEGVAEGEGEEGSRGERPEDAAAEAEAIAGASSDPCPVLPLVFTLPPPSRLPIGALTQLAAHQAAARAAAAPGSAAGRGSGGGRGGGKRGGGAGRGAAVAGGWGRGGSAKAAE